MGAPFDRRRFLRVVGGGLVAAGAAAGAAGCASLQAIEVRPRDGRIRLDPREHPRLGIPGEVLRVRPAGAPHPLLVLSEGDGRYTALSPVCTHQQCIVEPSGTRLACPCHGSEFDRTGAVLEGPAEAPLGRYPVSVAGDGTVTIDLREAS